MCDLVLNPNASFDCNKSYILSLIKEAEDTNFNDDYGVFIELVDVEIYLDDLLKSDYNPSISSISDKVKSLIETYLNNRDEYSSNIECTVEPEVSVSDILWSVFMGALTLLLVIGVIVSFV